MKQDTEEQTSAVPGTAHGEGWSPIRPDSDELFVAGVKIGERQADGTFVKLFRVLPTPAAEKERQRVAEQERIEKAKREALEREAQQKEIAHEAKRKRAQFRRKMRKLDEGIARVAKQEARLALFLMGKA
jgi:hypothetical protein